MVAHNYYPLPLSGSANTHEAERVNTYELEETHPIRESVASLSRSLLSNATDPETLGFRSRQTWVSMGLTGLYGLMNTVMAILQRDNPAISIANISNNTDYLPLLSGDFFKNAGLNHQVELEGTMYLKIVGAGILESFMLAADKFPNEMGLENKNRLALIAVVLVWSSVSALLMDSSSKLIERKVTNKNTVYSDHSHEAKENAAQHLCNVDYVLNQTRLIFQDEVLKRTDAPQSERFKSSKTSASFALLAGYTLLNLGMAYLQQDNTAAVLDILTDLTAYGGKIFGDTLKCYRQDAALDLDRTMHVKIVSAALIESVMLLAQTFPEAMGLQNANPIVLTATILGWALASSLITGVVSNSIQRAQDNVSIVYRDMAPEALRTPARFACAFDYAFMQVGMLHAST